MFKSGYRLAISFWLSFMSLALGQASLQVRVDRDPMGTGSASYSVGERLSIEAYSNVDGYIYLFSKGSSGHFQKLLPSELEANNFIQAGQKTVFPRNSMYSYQVDGPAGREEIIGLLSLKFLDEYALNQILSTSLHNIAIQNIALSEQPNWFWNSVAFNVIAPQASAIIPSYQAPPIAGLGHAEASLGATLNLGLGNQFASSATSSLIQQLNIPQPNNTLQFSSRKNPYSIDGSFESGMGLGDFVNYFATQLFNQGFQYEKQVESSFEGAFEGLFIFQGQKVKLSVLQSGIYFRFEIFHVM